MNVLALDTSSFGCSVCVLREDGAVFSDIRRMPSGQAEHLVPMVQGVMAQGGIEFSDLAAVISTIGPGAYTGLRIGLVTAKSFSMALGIPVYGVSSLQALAWQYAPSAERNFTVLVETRRADFYVQRFDMKGVSLSAPVCMMADAIQALDQTVLIGDCLDRYEQSLLSVPGKHILVQGYDVIDPSVIARQFIATRAETDSCFKPDPSPLYLREADVTAPKTQRIIAGA